MDISQEPYQLGIESRGAELATFRYRDQELLWQGDEKSWPRRAPVLFPVIGSLKNNRFYHGDAFYQPGFHGFAHRLSFEETRHQGQFVLKSSHETLKLYPFQFRLEIMYHLSENGLKVNYNVENQGQQNLPFSLGTHPGFNIPKPDLDERTWFIEFEKEENTTSFLIENSLIGPQKAFRLLGRRLINIEKNLSNYGTLVFPGITSSMLRLNFPLSGYSIQVQFENFPYLAFWKFKGAPFICIENWAGIPDTSDSDGSLVHKKGINALVPGTTWTASAAYRYVRL